ncbi:hypothetical membrane protein [Thermococcus kodakarensis KOD1]|uniref:Hypothetical membrane protein n=1 Tax=Thermococcus kodakarensis (strain ATCC BAA-918 / JCM 12380 / KOD1) TaxID=69014 RepID=Q5JEH8_THEKO|nr:hypothetical protein [Thermococcus kodakarensis]WCN28191.1 hypothetical protein POG15_00415 [Thermococcus kodakarensis]WCN30488.1 hypothetical protein POG21_00415 [Thermococcus kodakarensis]BAD84266.1 hypothetical membrane protein [Thermococcus kodakarensis KOD1]
MKKFIIFLLVILLFTAFLVGFNEFIKNVSLAIAIALVLRIVDEVVED